MNWNDLHFAKKLVLLPQVEQKFGLKDLFSFLRLTGLKGKISFSHSSGQHSLHQNLSIKENYLLDALPTCLIQESNEYLNGHIAELQNPFLKDLIHMTFPMHRMISGLNKKELALVNITKALLHGPKYLFLENPETYLNASELQIVKNTLVYEVEEHQLCVFVRSENAENWIDICPIILKKHETEFYKLYPNNLYPKIKFHPKEDREAA